MLRRAAPLAKTVVMKVGREGCLVSDGGERIAAPGFPVQAVDTTGAGDAFASGYLYGLLRGLEARRCARLANRLAACIVSIEGCDYDSLVAEGMLEGS